MFPSCLSSCARTVRSEVLKGFRAHRQIAPTFLTWCQLLSNALLGWLFPALLLPLVEFTIITMVLSRSSKPWISLLRRHLVSRIIGYLLLSSLYQEAEEGQALWISVLLLLLPILISGYLFEPLLLDYHRYGLSDRSDYFLSRYPFFFGYGTPLLLLTCLLLYLDQVWILAALPPLLLSHCNDAAPTPSTPSAPPISAIGVFKQLPLVNKTTATPPPAPLLRRTSSLRIPRYARYLPFTDVTFSLDLGDAVDEALR